MLDGMPRAKRLRRRIVGLCREHHSGDHQHRRRSRSSPSRAADCPALSSPGPIAALPRPFVREAGPQNHDPSRRSGRRGKDAAGGCLPAALKRDRSMATLPTAQGGAPPANDRVFTVSRDGERRADQSPVRGCDGKHRSSAMAGLLRESIRAAVHRAGLARTCLPTPPSKSAADPDLACACDGAW